MPGAREAVRLDARAVALAHAGPCLALAERVFGQTIALPAEAPANRLLAGASALAFGADAPEPEVAETGTAVALVQVLGPLAQRRIVDLCGYVDGYDAVAARLGAALADERVGSVVLVIDSPGGDAAGCFEAVRRMRAMVADAGKHVLAFADECACSAAYALATVASEIYLPPSGEIGSIGVIAIHMDESRALDQAGITPTIIRSGKRKAETNPIEPLSRAAHDALEGRVDELAGQFAELVADVRGGGSKKWLALEGAVLGGEDAVKAGLADGIKSLGQVVDMAAQAAGKRRETMGIDKALAALLGVKPEATADELKEVAAALEVGRAVSLLAPGKSVPETIAAVNAWRAAGTKVAELEQLEVTRAADAEKRERHELAAALVQGGRLDPAEAWKKGEDGKPSPALGVRKAWSTATLKEMAAGLRVQPGRKAASAPAPTGVTATDDDKAAAKRLGVTLEAYLESRNEVASAIDVNRGRAPVQAS